MGSVWKFMFWVRRVFRNIIHLLSADFSTPAQNHYLAKMPAHQPLYRSTVYTLEPASRIYAGNDDVRAVKPQRPPPERHVRGTGEIFRQIMTCARCGVEIDYAAPAEPCAQCQCEEVRVNECTCLHFPASTKATIVGAKTYTPEEISIRSETCPSHGRKPRPAT